MFKSKMFVKLSLIFLTLFLASHSFAYNSNEIILMSHDSFNVSENVVAAFEKKHNAKIRFLKAGGAGAALNQMLLSSSDPLADVFYGVDNTFMSRALKADVFEPYASPVLVHIKDELKLDKINRLLPVNYGDVCLNYDMKWFKKNNMRPPSDLTDLIRPEFKGLTVLENPATSSPGLSFLLATVGRFGESDFMNFWKKLVANDIFVTNGWEEAYWGQFSAASKGDRPIVVSYASSPAAEVHYSKPKILSPPTAAVLAPNSAFRQIEFVGIIKGTKKMDLAKKLVDFMLDTRFQEDIPLQMFVFPANKKAKLPEVFKKHAAIAKNPVMLTPEIISENRDQWIQQWTQTVLRNIK